MKNRKIVSLLIVVATLAMLLTGCGKSEAVKAAEEAIAAIGEVSIESEDAILSAEKLYSILTDSEKSEVSNRLQLVDARESFDKLQGDLAYENAKKAFEKLNDVADLCSKGMDDIYGAWYFGIHKADDSSTTYFWSDFAKETPHFTADELENGYASYLDLLGMDYSAMKSNAIKVAMSSWEYCLYAVESAITTRGDYEVIESEMSEAQIILQELTKTYGDYTYYPKLKDYYTAVNSYVEFFTSPSGSFNQLSDTVNNYETNIRNLRSDVGFLFNK